MKYVFYDFETSGLSSAYDSIIQAAAILTDENLSGKKCVYSGCAAKHEVVFARAY